MEENSVVQNNSIKLFQTNGVGPEKIRLFEDKKVRVKWDADEEDYYFSIVDVVAVLTENDFQTARNYWKVLKQRLLEEGNESVTNCHQLKLVASDGKAYSTDVANTEQNLTCKKVYKNSDFLAPLV